MFWIIGGDGICSAISGLSRNDSVKAVCAQFSEHVEWVGFHYYDMIFPLFLFIIGAVLPFSVGRRLEAGDSKKKVWLKVLERTAILFLFGLIYNGLFQFQDWEHLRIFGVLQRQAIGYGCAATLLIYTKPRTQAIVCGGILVFYFALLKLAPVPGVPLGDMSQWGNFPNYIDRLMLFPGQMYEKYGDPEGLISMIPAVSTALLGVFAGRWIKSEPDERRKVLGLVIAGAICLALGLAWAPFFPVIKKIWTSSYVLVAGGASMELLALFYWLIDVKGWTKWSLFFTVIGMNSITIYMMLEIVDFYKISTYFIGGILPHIGVYKDLVAAIGVVAVEWLVLYILYRQKIFLRV